VELPTEVTRELDELARRFGPPLSIVATIDDSFKDPIWKRDRYGEVCMVVRRPSGRILLSIKTFYPRGAHRLPTGGIRHGEGVYDALVRETHEETGLSTAVRRFLARISYAPLSSPAAPPPFADESRLFDRYGVRVPAFLISPWLQPKSVAHTLLDHTSVLKTILEKFCRDPQGQIPYLSARVANANSLSQVFDALQTASVRTDAPLAPVVTPAAGIRRLAAGEAAPPSSAFQQLMQGVKEHCLSQGVPPEQL